MTPSKRIVAVTKSTVRRASPLSREVVIEDDGFDNDGRVDSARCAGNEPLQGEQSWARTGYNSDEDEDGLPDAMYSQMDGTQGEQVFRSPSPPAPEARDVDHYLQQYPLYMTIYLMPQDDAIGMYQACQREGHKAAVKFVPGGRAILKYSKRARAFREVGSYVTVRVLSTTERRISGVATSIRRVSRSIRPFIWHPSLWVLVLGVGLAITFATILAMCLGFDVCVDVVSSPAHFLAELALLVLGCLLYASAGIVSALHLFIICISTVTDFLIANTTLANQRARHVARTLIRSAVTFLEAFIKDDL